MRLSEPRGPLSQAVATALTNHPGDLQQSGRLPQQPLTDDDLQLALYWIHELSYGGIEGVSDDWEWDPSLIRFRTRLEGAILDELVEAVGPPRAIGPAQVPEAVFALVSEDDGPPLARYIEKDASIEQVREFLMHRSAYQLKEADPHTFGIPRIAAAAKGAMVEIQADEYGGGDPRRMHSALFGRSMRAIGLDDTFGAYVPDLPGSTLATVNLISVFGLRRRWRGALVGHLAAFEISSPEPNRRYANGLRRLGLGPDATEFFDEHVEADSVHENIAAYDLAGGLASQEPALAGDIVFGARALLHCEARFAGHILDRWQGGDTSLLSRQAERALA